MCESSLFPINNIVTHILVIVVAHKIGAQEVKPEGARVTYSHATPKSWAPLVLFKELRLLLYNFGLLVIVDEVMLLHPLPAPTKFMHVVRACCFGDRHTPFTLDVLHQVMHSKVGLRPRMPILASTPRHAVVEDLGVHELEGIVLMTPLLRGEEALV